MLANNLIFKYIQKMAVYLLIFKHCHIFVYELFETMQNSVTRSRTFVSKSLSTSFKPTVFFLIIR